MEKFEVVNYKFSTSFSRKDDGKWIIERILEMDSAAMYHGIVVKVQIVFATYFNNYQTSSIGYYQANDNGYGATIFGWFPESEHDEWLDLVRTEKPLYFHYNIKNTNGATYIDKMKLSSSKEDLGEGLFEMENFKKAMKEAIQET